METKRFWGKLYRFSNTQKLLSFNPLQLFMVFRETLIICHNTVYCVGQFYLFTHIVKALCFCLISDRVKDKGIFLILLHSEQPKLHRVLAVLSALGLSWCLVDVNICRVSCLPLFCNNASAGKTLLSVEFVFIFRSFRLF